MNQCQNENENKNKNKNRKKRRARTSARMKTEKWSKKMGETEKENKNASVAEKKINFIGKVYQMLLEIQASLFVRYAFSISFHFC